MDDASLEEIVKEIAPLLIGRAAGKIFQLGPASLAIDFGVRDRGYLFISVDPAQPRLYLIKRRVRDLEKQVTPPTPFALTLRKELSGTQLDSLVKDAGDRIIRFLFSGRDELGNLKDREFVAQLTGRSANLLLLDDRKTIIQRARPTDIPGQQVGDLYREPASESKPVTRESKLLKQIRSQEFNSVSEAADAYFDSLLKERSFDAQAAAARADLRKKLTQQQKLLKQLQRDLESHADAEQQKRLGDLLLANLSTAKRAPDRVTLIDYFADDAGPIEIELDESVSLQEEASRRFGLYSRSKRAVTQINSRIELVRKRLAELLSEQESLEKRILAAPTAAGAPSALASVPPAVAGGLSTSSRQARTKRERIPGTRRYLSTEGFEILVGRTARDNDHLTFKIAKPNDLWLHAADYGGSHVVVRNSTKKPVPHGTLIEAAQLAAWFSQAKKDPKVDVHYTERKFVTKIKGAKPGLVRLQRFKNITIQPKEAGTRA
jgi:predicted ribosome quality control (RQC) complex YloA/Tae2 family protein